MALSKTITASGSHGHHTFTLTITETAVNASANSSTCTVKFTIKPKNTGYNWEDFTGSEMPKGTVTFNGASYSWQLPNYDGKSTVTLVNKTVTVAHASNGTKTVSFSFSCSSGSTSFLPGSASGSGSLALTAIARVPTVTQKVSSKTETSITMSWSSDLVIDTIRYSTNGGSTWTSKNVTDGKSGSYTVSGLSANTTYTMKTELHSKASGLTGQSSNLSVKTYNWPYATPSTMTVKNGGSVTVTNPLGRSFTLVVYAEGQEIDRDTGVIGSYEFYPPSWIEAFLDKIPNSMTGTWTCEVTYEGHTIRKSATYSAAGYNPRVTAASYQDANTQVQSIIQDDQTLLQNVSTPRITASGAGQYGATIASASVEILGRVSALAVSNNTATGVAGAIDSATNVTAKVTLTDTRGNTGSKNITLTMAAYTLPSASIKLARKNNFYSETDITVDASVMQLGNNAPIISARWKPVDSSTWSNPQTIPDNVLTALNGSTGLDNTQAWNVQVTITDSFGGAKTYNATVEVGMPILYIDRAKRSVGINSFPTEDDQLVVNNIDILARLNPIGAITGSAAGGSLPAVSVPSGTWTRVHSFNLTPGLYIVKAMARFASNATGTRAVAIATTSGAAADNVWDTAKHNADSAGYSYVHLITFLRPTQDTTYYINAQQSSGASLSTTPRFGAIRIM